MDSLEFDIKYLLMNSPRTRLQWRALRDGLNKNYEKDYKTKYSFGVVLQRKLNFLCSSGDLEKEVKGHQKVFYFIPKKSRKKIERELNDELGHDAFDKIWEKLTPEQRKITVEKLTETQRLMGLLVQESYSTILKAIGDLTNMWIKELENPSENTKSKLPSAQREQYLREITKLRGQCERTDIDAPTTQALKEKLSTYINLAQSFMEEIVEPDYSGKWDEAIMDLMRKAIEEKKGKRK